MRERGADNPLVCNCERSPLILARGLPQKLDSDFTTQVILMLS